MRHPGRNESLFILRLKWGAGTAAANAASENPRKVRQSPLRFTIYARGKRIKNQKADIDVAGDVGSKIELVDVSMLINKKKEVDRIGNRDHCIYGNCAGGGEVMRWCEIVGEGKGRGAQDSQADRAIKQADARLRVAQRQRKVADIAK